MSFELRILIISVAFINFIFMIRKLRKAQLKLMEAFYWILFSLILVIISIFPQICEWLAYVLKVESPVNFVYLVIIFLLIVKIFLLDIRISIMEDKIINLVQEVAIKEASKIKSE